MSGGSYNYLCRAFDLDDLLDRRGSLREMADRLAGLGYAEDAAKETEELLVLLNQWGVRAEVRRNRLAEVWKAVEWWDSCDSGPDGVRKALDELLNPTPPAPPAPKYCCEHDDDAHDGAGCLDCSCNLGPMHTKAGYNPTPTSVVKARADVAARLRP